MRHPISSSPTYTRFNSYDKIASQLLQDWPDVFEKPGRDKGVTKRSLGAKLGELDRGTPTWWLKREVETNCLVELLELDRDELGLHQRTGRHIFSFEVFPEFPPLDLMRENYWSIAQPELLSAEGARHDDYYSNRSKPTLDAWLSSQGNLYSRGKVEWLYVPDKLEYQLLTRKLDAVGRHQYLSRRSLREVITHDLEQLRNQNPLILAIHGMPETDTLTTLINYRDGAPLLIISPLPLPQARSNSNETSLTTDTTDQVVAESRDINNWLWTLSPEWREQLTQWLEKRTLRLGVDTLFTSEATQDLLKTFDPAGKWFVSVEDVLVMCQAVSERRERKLRDSAGSGSDISLLLSLLFNSDKANLGLMQPLIERRWKHWDLSWEGELAQTAWSDIAGDLCRFDTMLNQQLIVKGEEGYEFQRPILIRLILRSQLMTALDEGDLGFWAPACFDSRRRPLVDAALDAIDIEQLENLTAQLLETRDSIQTIGAAEALFAAIGRRIVRQDYSAEKLPELAEYVLKQLTWDSGLLYPCSRPLTTTDEQLEWICVCWAWSLTSSPLEGLPPNWLFPGWSSSPTKKLPQWIKFYAGGNARQNWEDMVLPMRDFLIVVTRWLGRHETAPDSEDTPLLFRAGLLACAAEDQWPADPYWWRGLLDHPIAQRTLLHHVESANASVNLRTALAWWPSLVKHQRARFSATLTHNSSIGSDLFTRNPKHQRYSTLLNWVMSQVDKHGDKVLLGLDEDDRKFLLLHPAALSTSVKRQLLRSLAKDFPMDWSTFEFVNIFLQYGPETAKEMELFLDHKELGAQAAAYLWEWAPRNAQSLLHRKTSSKVALRRLILVSPPAAVGDVLILLKEDHALLGDKELIEWARWRLPDARRHAHDMMELLSARANVRKV